MECMDLHKAVSISENSSVESDSRDKSDLNETVEQYIVDDHSTRRYFSK